MEKPGADLGRGVCIGWLATPYMTGLPKSCRLHLRFLFKDYSTLGVRYRDLPARVYKQETRNLTLHEAQPSAVLIFEFLVCKRVLVDHDNARTKSAANVLIFSLSKPLK